MTGRTTGNLRAYAELPGTPDAAGQARAIVRQALGDRHPHASDATVIASELVSNAVLHTRSGQPGGTLILSVATAAQPGEVHIHVRDAGDPDSRLLDAPVPSASDPDAEHGRGLAIVDALAADWGAYVTSSGQTTWARISPRRYAHPGPRLPEREAG